MNEIDDENSCINSLCYPKLTFTDNILINSLINKPFFLITIYRAKKYFPFESKKKIEQMTDIINKFQGLMKFRIV